MKKLKLTHFTDPGHSWYGVKRKLLNDLGIADKISGFSYQRGNMVYLEEDCDIGIFLKAYFKGEIPDQWWTLPGIEIKKSMNRKAFTGHSPIRSYERYRNELPGIIQAAKNLNLIEIYYLK